MASIAKKSVLWITVSFLCFVLLLAICNGAAQFFSLSARADMDAWIAQKREPSESEISSTIHKLQWAVRLADGDSYTRLDFARLSLIRASYTPDATLRQQRLREGLLEIRIGLDLNPSSPYHWTYLLLLKRGLGEFDAEFRHALHRAVEMGPWELRLFMAQADVGLSAWKELPPEDQAIVQQIIVRGMERKSKEMLAVVDSHRSDCDEEMACQ